MAKSYRHLEVQERALIEAQLRLDMKPAVIAAALMRSRSTITREIRRNGWQSDAEMTPRSRTRIAGGYRCVTADRRARLLTNKPRRLRKLIPGNPLWSVVIDYLRQGLSPAQIQSTLGRMPNPVQLCYETIYTALYTMPCGHLRSSLLALMRRTRQGWAQQTLHSRDGSDRSAAHRSPDAPHPGSLGGRSDDRQGQPLAGRHAGRTHHPVCRPGQAEQQ